METTPLEKTTKAEFLRLHKSGALRVAGVHSLWASEIYERGSADTEQQRAVIATLKGDGPAPLVEVYSDIMNAIKRTVYKATVHGREFFFLEEIVDQSKLEPPTAWTTIYLKKEEG
jgi:hypothetical protein